MGDKSGDDDTGEVRWSRRRDESCMLYEIEQSDSFRND